MVRIRKSSTISPLLFCSHVAPEDIHPHICRLNQSPWDTSPFDIDSSSTQFELDVGSLNVNGSLGGSVGAVESVASPCKAEDTAVDVEEGSKGSDAGVVIIEKAKRCRMENGKGWCCKERAVKGFSLCEYHVANHVRYRAQAAALARSRRAKLKKKKASNSKTHEFVYYSVGPKRGRKRRNKKDKKDKKGVHVKDVGTSSNIASITQDTQPPHKIDDESQLNYFDDLDDEDDWSDGSGRKRARKPVKARSLMSLLMGA